MDPFMMTALYLVLGLSIFNLFRKPKVAAPAKAIEPVASSDHQLVKTWIEMSSYSIVAGWRAKCSCGAVCYSTNSKEGKSYGSETNVVEAFQRHAKLFAQANGTENPLKAEVESLKAQLEAQSAACFCKDVSTVQLLPMKD